MIWSDKGENVYSQITPAIRALEEQWEKKNYIDPRLYQQYNVRRGLRDEDGQGVLTGLTRVGEIQSYTVEKDGSILPEDGVLYYRGIDCREIVRGSEGRRLAFEEAAYLLLFGELPSEAQLRDFCVQLATYRTLPSNFLRDVILKAPPQDLMNTMTEGHYAVEFLKTDHQRLWNALADCKGKWMVSYNDCEFIRELYQEYTITPVTRLSNLAQRYDGGCEYPEVIITNYDPKERERDTFQLNLFDFGGEYEE